MATTFKKGDNVSWDWSGSTSSGTVESVSSQRTEITSKGSKIVRNGSKDDPAVTITDDNGAKVLKLASELKRS